MHRSNDFIKRMFVVSYLQREFISRFSYTCRNIIFVPIRYTSACVPFEPWCSLYQVNRCHETLLISLISAFTLPWNANGIMLAFIFTLRGKKRGAWSRGKKDKKIGRERERGEKCKRGGNGWKSERGKKRRGKRPQILFQVKGFLSRHLPCAREPLKIKTISRNVFSLSALSKLDKRATNPVSTGGTSFFHCDGNMPLAAKPLISR